MATITVWKFPTPEGADQTEDELKAMQKEGLIEIQDAATVASPGRQEAEDQAAEQPDRRGALGGSSGVCSSA